MPCETDLTIRGGGTMEQEEVLSTEEQAAIRSGKLTICGICEVKRDELQLCLSEPGLAVPSSRPTEFSAGESSEHTLFVVKRTQP
jgi:hypothetical protein